MYPACSKKMQNFFMTCLYTMFEHTFCNECGIKQKEYAKSKSQKART